MSKRITHLFMVFVIGVCLSLPMTVSANAEVGADGTDPVGAPTEQCPSSTPKTATSTAVIDGEGQTTDGQTQESSTNDCSDWQVAPVSWNS
jgi:hypothetical protein